MMDDLASAEFNTAEAEVVARDLDFMPRLTDYVLERVVIAGAAAADVAVQTVPIRRDRPAGAEIPKSLFMIYLKLDDTKQLIVRQMRLDNFATTGPGYTLDGAEDFLLKEARKEPPGQYYEASNFSNMVWQRPYYLTFVIDNADWEFYWHESNLHEAIRLLQQKDVPGSHTTYQGENHTFFEAKEDIPLASYGDAFRVMNCYCDANGTIEDDEAQLKYCFEIYLKAPFKDAVGGHITMLIDPDGQNQGPRT